MNAIKKYSILSIEEPLRCRDCPCYDEYKCKVTGEKIGVARSMTTRLKSCPMIPIPAKRKCVVEWLYSYGTIRTHELTEYDKGWNDCVDYMLSGEKKC